MSLVQLPPSTIKLITSSQIITSVSSAVKELFENALDAGATSVDVKLINYGLDRIEVKDNGLGISKENITCMALPHYTSKISNFSDLESLETYGFRGEALNALCRVSQVSITTATSIDPTAVVYTLDSSGNITGSKPAPHVQGTSVGLSNLFKNLPVRRQFMGSNRKAQEELKQVECVVKSLAVIKPNIRVTLSHNKCLIWQKTPCNSLLNSFSQLVGFATCNQLEQLSLKISSEVHVELLVPKRDCEIALVSKSTPSLSLVFVNERPVIYKKIIKILHHQLIQKFRENFSPRKFAVCLICIKSNPSHIDVNLEPNKTKVLMQDEDEILCKIEKQLEVYYRVPNLDSKNDVENEMNKEEQVQFPMRQHTPPLDAMDDIARKKRKVDDNCSSMEHASPPGDSSHNASGWSLSELQNHGKHDGEEVIGPMKEQETDGHTVPNSADCFGSQTAIIYPVVAGSPSFQDELSVTRSPMGNPSVQDVLSMNDGVDQEDPQEKEKSFTPLQNHCNQVNPASDPLGGHDHVETLNVHNIDQLWESAPNHNLQELSDCLDAMVNDPGSPAHIQPTEESDAFKEVNVVASEAWSMGHVIGQQGDFMKGSSVLVGGLATPLFGQTHQSPPNSQSNKSDVASDLFEGPKISSSRLDSPPKSHRQKDSNGLSPGIDSSLQSVSSQMGRRELAAFTKFAREVRPQIILDNPGIAFTHVASMLAEKWQLLSEKEREHYEELARQTATTKKIWKTADKQKKLEWVRQLPSNEEKKNARVRPTNHNRPPRREVQFTADLNSIRDKISRAPLIAEWHNHQASRGSCFLLVGRLEPSGFWICLKNSTLILLNHSRLQEVVINHRLLSTHTLLLKPLPSLEHLDSNVLGEEAWRTLLSLSCRYDEFRQTKVVSEDLISKNGFKIEVQGDNQSAKLTETAETLNYYGIKELKETLHLGKNWPAVKLCDCRPLRVASHIKGEAMRICRKSPTVLERTMVQELLDYWRTVMRPEDLYCLHSKPILTSFYCLFGKKTLL